jgi:hypothetical protein
MTIKYYKKSPGKTRGGQSRDLCVVSFLAMTNDGFAAGVRHSKRDAIFISARIYGKFKRSPV